MPGMLSTLDLFQGLPQGCLQALEETSELREFRSGQVIFRAGETGQRLFVLEKGQVQTFRTSGAHKLVIAELKPPAIFGEMVLAGRRYITVPLKLPGRRESAFSTAPNWRRYSRSPRS